MYTSTFFYFYITIIKQFFFKISIHDLCIKVLNEREKILNFFFSLHKYIDASQWFKSTQKLMTNGIYMFNRFSLSIYILESLDVCSKLYLLY